MNSDFVPYALVADDDALIRMDAHDILKAAGFRVFEAANVEEALKVLERDGESIALLFTDVQMPPSTLNGFYLARQCAERWPHIGILVASGMLEPEGADLPEGAVFLRKPFSSEVVYAHLQNILPDGQQPEPLKTARH